MTRLHWIILLALVVFWSFLAGIITFGISSDPRLALLIGSVTAAFCFVVLLLVFACVIDGKQPS